MQGILEQENTRNKSKEQTSAALSTVGFHVQGPISRLLVVHAVWQKQPVVAIGPSENVMSYLWM